MKISVVMSVYNGEKYLHEAINSILNQTLSDFEFIIINDGSTDNSLNIIEEYEKKDNRIRIIDRENRGLSCSLNEGIKIARSELIARMDADDISKENRLEVQVDYLDKNKEIGLVGTWVKLIDENGCVKGVKKEPIDPEEIIDKILTYSCFNHGSVIFQKSIFEKAGKYSNAFPENPPNEDFALWNRMLQIASGANISQYLYKLRQHSSSVSYVQNEAQAEQHFLVSKKYILIKAEECEKIHKKSELSSYMYKLGDIHYHYRKLKDCRSYFVKALLLNPFIDIKAYRYLFFSYLGETLLNKLVQLRTRLQKREFPNIYTEPRK